MKATSTYVGLYEFVAYMTPNVGSTHYTDHISDSLCAEVTKKKVQYKCDYDLTKTFSLNYKYSDRMKPTDRKRNGLRYWPQNY